MCMHQRQDLCSTSLDRLLECTQSSDLHLPCLQPQRERKRCMCKPVSSSYSTCYHSPCAGAAHCCQEHCSSLTSMLSRWAVCCQFCPVRKRAAGLADHASCRNVQSQFHSECASLRACALLWGSDYRQSGVCKYVVQVYCLLVLQLPGARKK